MYSIPAGDYEHGNDFGMDIGYAQSLGRCILRSSPEYEKPDGDHDEYGDRDIPVYLNKAKIEY